MATIECGGFLFYSNFDSGNLARVEWVPRNESGKHHFLNIILHFN